MASLDVERLIKAVRGFPCLWQIRRKSHKDSRVKENAWKSVAADVGATVELCMKRWKNLRDRYGKELKKTKNPSGSKGPPRRSSWQHFETLPF